MCGILPDSDRRSFARLFPPRKAAGAVLAASCAAGHRSLSSKEAAEQAGLRPKNEALHATPAGSFGRCGNGVAAWFRGAGAWTAAASGPAESTVQFAPRRPLIATACTLGRRAAMKRGEGA